MGAMLLLVGERIKESVILLTNEMIAGCMYRFPGGPLECSVDPGVVLVVGVLLIISLIMWGIETLKNGDCDVQGEE